MKKLSRNEMKKINGGKSLLAACGVKCVDGLFHEINCGTNACETTLGGNVNCTSGINIVSTHSPCAGVVPCD